MAATTIKTNTVYDSYFWVKWESGGQDVSANKTAINWSCGVKPGHKFYSNAVKMSAVSIGGVTVYAGGTYSNITDYKEHTFASGTLEVSHNADGSKTLTVSAFSGQVWKDSGYLTATAAAQSFQLAAIPRATEPVMGAATMGEAVRISLPRASSAFTHTLSYVFGAASGTIAENAGTEVQWTVPESLAAQIPDSSVGTGTLTCRTYNGGTLVGTKAVPFTATVPQSMKPALTNGWAAVSYDNSGTKASGIAAWVQGYSKAKAVFNGSKVTCKQGASIAKYAVTYLGKTVEESPYRTETISTTSATVRCTVTDSRGLTAWEDFNISLLEYTPPALVGADLFRSDGEGIAADGGLHIAGVARARYSELGGLNSVTLKGYWKLVGGSYGAGETMTVGTVGLVTGNVEISADRSYIALLVLTDSLGNSARYEENIPTERVAFHLKEGGNGAAFGKVAETEYALELAEDWELKVKGKRLLDLIYPVGSIYLSVNSASPDTLFGGTWEQIQGRFLLGVSSSYPAGSTGGEAQHTLTEAELPSHRHSIPSLSGSAASDGAHTHNVSGGAGSGGSSAGLESYGSGYSSFRTITNAVQSAGAHTHTVTTTASNTGYTGSGSAHNNMPPYLAVYIWKRTA